MNKDVLTINPDDDIADIINMLKGAKSKIVAIIPPESPTVLRSSVNIRLIKKTADSIDKIPVLITTDASLIKLAKEHSLHVSDGLQSKPYIPSEETDTKEAEHSPAQVAADFISPANHIPDYTKDSDSADASAEDPEEVDEETLEEATEETTDLELTSDKTSPKNFRDWFTLHKKAIIISASAFVVVAAFLIWAIVFSPFVTIKVAIHTTSSNFSENVTFTRDQKEEDSSTGIFYLTEEKYEDKSEVEFKATGKRNDGKKASGELIVASYFKKKNAAYTIPANTRFSHNGVIYSTTESTSISWADGDTCENRSDDDDSFFNDGCRISGAIKISATEPGEDYNIPDASYDWEIASDGIYLSNIHNDSAIEGGTTEMVTVVSQADIDNAIKKLEDAVSDVEAKKKLTEGLSNTTFVVESSFKRGDAEIKTSVNAGDKVEKGKITKATTFYIYTIDSVRLEEFIAKKATLADDQKIYAITSPFIERFQQSGDDFTAKLKTTYNVGPKVTENDVREKATGKKIGEVQSLLKSINGVSNVDIQTSYFWVSKVPTNANRISITVEVE